MKKTIYLLLILIMPIFLHGQKDELYLVSGKFTFINSTKPIPCVQVFIINEKNDTLAQIESNTEGEFGASFQLDSLKKHYIHFKHAHKNPVKHLFYEPSTSANLTWYFEFQLYPDLIDHFDPSFYYLVGHIHYEGDFDFHWFRSIMEENPLFYFRVVQSIHPNESKRIARKRMKHFKKRLERENIDLKRIRLESKPLILSDKSIETNPKSRIQFIAEL